MSKSAKDLIRAAPKYLGVPYSKLDCQAFVEACLKDIGISKNLPGSNAWYRTMTWTGTPEECRASFGKIPVGAFLFILAQDGGEPDKYKSDGIGNASHIGIYTGTGKGAWHSSASVGMVCESKFNGKSIKGGWNRIGLWDALNYDLGSIQPANGGNKMTAKVWADNGGTVNMRTGSSAESGLITRVPIGAVVTVLESGVTWSKITYENWTGYMMTKFLMDEASGADGESVTVSRKELEGIYDQIGNMLGLSG